MRNKKSFLSASLNRKAWVSLSLVSLIPVLVFVYHFQGNGVSFWSLLVLLFIILLGWAIVFKILSTVKKLHHSSKKALESVGEKIPQAVDELQSLEGSIAILTDKVKTGFGQLQSFSQKIDDLNQKVSRKVLTLSVILQANDLFSKQTEGEEVVNFLVYHLQQILGGEICFCLARDRGQRSLRLLAANGLDSASARALLENKEEALLRLREPVIVDSAHQSESFSDILALLPVKNMIIAPVIVMDSTMGLVGVAHNQESFSFAKDDIDTLNLFAQNIAFIWDREELSSKVKTLEVIDKLTGLYNERMLNARLEEEIKRAGIYQRPCSFITVELIAYEQLQAQIGVLEGEKILKEAAVLFKESLSAVDIAGRIGPGQLAAVLIERNKRQAKKTIEELNSKLLPLCRGRIALSFSLAESPVDGMNAKELLDFARANKIEIR